MKLYDLLKLHGDSTHFVFRLFYNGTRQDFSIDEIPFRLLMKYVLVWELEQYDENTPLYDGELIVFKIWLESGNE